MSQPSFVDRIQHIESRGRRFGSDGKILQGPQTRYGTAKGEMQVLDGTARDPGYGVAPARDGSPEELARVGKDYAMALLNLFKGDEAKAGAAYNYGPGNVQKLLAKHGDNWISQLPKETKNYVAALGKQVAPMPNVALPPAAAAGAPQRTAMAVVQEPEPMSAVVPVQEAMAMRVDPVPTPANEVIGPDPWQEFLRSIPGQAQPVQVADLDYGNPKTGTRLPQFQYTQTANLRPNFEAFSSWNGRAA